MLGLYLVLKLIVNLYNWAVIQTNNELAIIDHFLKESLVMVMGFFQEKYSYNLVISILVNYTVAHTHYN